MRKTEMVKIKSVTFRLLMLAIAFSAVIGEDFGARLTTENLDTKENMQYRFHYFVKDDVTGDYKTQEETKEGDSVHGTYTLAEPNGNLRTVTYKAGPGKGFEAKVDVQPSGSLTKQITEKSTVLKASTVSDIKTIDSEKISKTVNIKPTLESNVRHFPGGFIMNVLSKPRTDIKTGMGMRFSLKASPVTEPATEITSNNAITFMEIKATEVPETTLEVTQTTNAEPSSDVFVNSTVENSALLTEGREIKEDPIEKELDEVINSMPKLPELVLPDNKTHFKFHKDPEEALLDERITQIARQLAETSLRREYEESKLGHFIPISVSPIELSGSSYLSKAFKFSKNDPPTFRPSESPPLNVITQLRVVPQFFYKQTLIPNISSINRRLPIMSIPFQQTRQWEEQTPETITYPRDLLKINKVENPITEINTFLKEKDMKYSTVYETTDPQTISVLPVQVPTFFQFFSPYVMHTPENYVTSKQPEQELQPSTVKKDLTMRKMLKTSDDKKLYAQKSLANYGIAKKS